MRNLLISLRQLLGMIQDALLRDWLNAEVVRAFALQSVNLEFIFEVESCQMTLKNGIHSFLAWNLA